MVGMDRVAAPGGGGGQDGYDYGGGGYDAAGMGQPGQQQAFGNIPGAAPRPKVDPEAMGEVDPTAYPEPKESTHKIRGRSDILEMLCGTVDQELLTVKTFYFCFYSAFGSLFPLMGVYFKQMGMNAGQCGLLIGSRPFVEFLSAPFWGSLADRWQKGKVMLLASLGAWILFTLPLGFIQPPAVNCLQRGNGSSWVISGTRIDQAGNVIQKRSVSAAAEAAAGVGDSQMLFSSDAGGEWTSVAEDSSSSSGGGGGRRVRRRTRPHVNAGENPIPVTYAENYQETQHLDLVSPLFSSMVYRAQDIEKAFFLLLLLVIIGEFFSAPAITLADSAVITLLGEDADRYGHQRMFGSLGWGLAMFFVGIALDHSTAFPGHPCGPDAHEKNYTICFATFSVLMGAALITATQIQFRYDVPGPEELAAAAAAAQPPVDPAKAREDQLQAQLAQQLDLPQLAPPPSAAATQPEVPTLVGKTKMFAQTTRQMPEWVTVMKQFANLKCGSFLFVAWFMGFGIGLIFTFLFWHLQDYGGSPTLFGVASVINHISEIFAYFFSFRLIRQMGHVKVLCLGLAGNVLRFLYIAYITNPWWVLPFEFMQGITHAAVWAACCSYIAHNTPQQLRSSAQGVLQGIHHGLGRGCGAVFGGIFVSYFGTTATFCGYGVCCLLVLAAFIFINFYRRDTGFVSELPVTEDPHQVAEETAHLAPHGVPSNPLPRALSSSRLHELAGPDAAGYGATSYQAADGSLGIPGAPSNPFLQNGGGGYNYSGGGGQRHSTAADDHQEAQQAQQPLRSDETIRRNFQRYNEVLSQYQEGGASKADVVGPSPATRLQTQQPLPSTAHEAYDW